MRCAIPRITTALLLGALMVLAACGHRGPLSPPAKTADNGASTILEG